MIIKGGDYKKRLTLFPARTTNANQTLFSSQSSRASTNDIVVCLLCLQHCINCALSSVPIESCLHQFRRNAVACSPSATRCVEQRTSTGCCLLSCDVTNLARVISRRRGQCLSRPLIHPVSQQGRGRCYRYRRTACRQLS